MRTVCSASTDTPGIIFKGTGTPGVAMVTRLCACLLFQVRSLQARRCLNQLNPFRSCSGLEVFNSGIAPKNLEAIW